MANGDVKYRRTLSKSIQKMPLSFDASAAPASYPSAPCSAAVQRAPSSQE
jgi:hypothetical protein